jgi:uncharacterized membrane protein
MRWQVQSPINRLRRPRDERGVMVLMIALITSFTLVPLAAYAVDIGMQRVARRDVQVVADVVALDLARQLDGRTYSQIQGSLQTLADKSAARNSAGSVAPTVTAQLGMLDDHNWSTSDPDAYFTPITSDAGGIPNAVKVTARTRMNFSIEGGSGGANRTAIARSQSNACFRMGSFAARVSTSGSLLNGLLNDSLNLTVLGYQGLASSNISLGDLAAELGAGTPDELMALDNVSLGTLFSAAAHVLQSNGGSAANVTLLNSMASSSFSGVTHTSVKMSDLLNLTASSGDDSAFATSLNLYDLVATTAFVANGTNFLAIPNITVGIPGLAPSMVTASLKVIQAPERTCGPTGTTLTTSQVTLNLTVNLPSTGISLGILGLLTTSSTLTATVNLAQATGTLTKVVCGPGATDGGVDVQVDSALSKVTTSLHVDIKSLGITAATVDTGAGSTVLGSSSSVSIRVPPDTYNTPKSTGPAATFTTMNNITSTDVHLLGLGLGFVGNVVAGVNTGIIQAYVNPLTVNLNNVLITPLAQALGLRIAGADVFGVDHPECGAVSLAG